MGKFKDIIEGWTHVILGTTIEQASARAEICSNCPSAQRSKWLETIFGSSKTNEVEGYACKECGCPIKTKINAPAAKCPLNKWQ